MERSTCRRLVDRPDEPDVRRGDAVGVAVCDRIAQPPGERLHRRPVADVLEPILGGRADALLLLLDVRHFEAKPATSRAPAMVPERRLRPAGAAATSLPILAAW